MAKGITVTAKTSIDAPISGVWDALVNPDVIKRYMFDTDVESDWEEGSPIVWKGVWKDKPYEDKGKILKIEPETLLKVSHYSPLSGDADEPENYHTLTYELAEEDGKTTVSLSQDNNKDEKAAEHSRTMWEGMLKSLKKLLEDQG